MDWGSQIVGQLEFYWDAHLWPRLQGLTTKEYLWEPVDAMISVRPRHDGLFVVDQPALDADGTEPVSTIAWRIMHLAAHGLANRASAFFGEDPFGDVEMNDPVRWPDTVPGTANEALAYFEQAYRGWIGPLGTLSDAELSRPLGPKGGLYADDTLAGLAIHINREMMHHGGEICLLRDLYARG